MNVPEKIFRLLAPSGVPYCDDCIQSQLGLARRQQVQPVTATLCLTSEFARGVNACNSCGREKLCTRYLGPA